MSARLGSAVPALVTLAAAALIGCGDDSPGEPAPPPGDFVGLVSQDVVDPNPGYQLSTMKRQAEAGTGLLRALVFWEGIELKPGRYRVNYYDPFMEGLARSGLDFLPVLGNPPEFHSSAPERGRRRGVYPPADPRTMGRFAAAMVRRFGPDGAFWREHPELPERPIRSWQVWNEPSLPVYWASGPDAAEYVRLLRVVSQAIKGVDPGAEIVSAGLPESRLGVPFADYLNDLYDAGGERWFDTLAVHPYAEDAEAAVEAVRGARRIMRARGDDARIWVTELGWASGGVGSPFTVGEQGQAERIASSLRVLAEKREELGVRGAVIYNWIDVPRPPGERDFFGFHTGLLAVDHTPKPALRAYEAAARPISR